MGAFRPLSFRAEKNWFRVTIMRQKLERGNAPQATKRPAGVNPRAWRKTDVYAEEAFKTGVHGLARLLGRRAGRGLDLPAQVLEGRVELLVLEFRFRRLRLLAVATVDDLLVALLLGQFFTLLAR